jgi:hypothetical protein
MVRVDGQPPGTAGSGKTTLLASGRPPTARAGWSPRHASSDYFPGQFT